MLVTSMLTEIIHQILAKTQWNQRAFVDMTFPPTDRCAAILAWLFIWFQISCKNALRACRWSRGHHTAENMVTHLEEIVIGFEFTNKWLFNVAGRVFKACRCHFIDKKFEMLMFITCNKSFKHYFSLIMIFQSNDWSLINEINLTAQIPEQTIDVIFLFFCSYSLVFHYFYVLYYLKNTSIKQCKWHLFSFWGCLKVNVITILIMITFNVIVIDYIVILFIRNRNWACGK